MDDMGSFPQPMQNFRLSGEDESPLHAPGVDAGGPSAVFVPSPAHAQPPRSIAVPLTRSRSGAETIEMFVEELDETIDAYVLPSTPAVLSAELASAARDNFRMGRRITSPSWIEIWKPKLSAPSVRLSRRKGP